MSADEPDALMIRLAAIRSNASINFPTDQMRLITRAVSYDGHLCELATWNRPSKYVTPPS
jgi:hypothetical protein